MREPEQENKYAVLTAAQVLAIERLTPFDQVKIFFGRDGAAVIYAQDDRKALVNQLSKTQAEIKLAKKNNSGTWNIQELFVLDTSED